MGDARTSKVRRIKIPTEEENGAAMCIWPKGETFISTWYQGERVFKKCEKMSPIDAFNIIRKHAVNCRVWTTHHKNKEVKTFEINTIEDLQDLLKRMDG